MVIGHWLYECKNNGGEMLNCIKFLLKLFIEIQGCKRIVTDLETIKLDNLRIWGNAFKFLVSSNVLSEALQN